MHSCYNVYRVLCNFCPHRENKVQILIICGYIMHYGYTMWGFKHQIKNIVKQASD